MKRFLQHTLFFLGTLAGTAGADSTIDPAAAYAYAANLGWVSFLHDRPTAPDGVVVGEYYCSGSAYSANAGWIDFGDGSPADGIRYANTDGADAGVNHDGAGNLSGLAWGANVGWINFGWASASDPNRPRIDLRSGEFAGFAWGANVGWINLGSGQLATRAIIYLHDSDGDGLSDPWELEQAGNLTTMGSGTDLDGDGATDAVEYCWATDPSDPNSRPQADIQIDFSTNSVRVTWTASPTRTYTLQRDTDLKSWTPAAAAFLGSGPTLEIVPDASLTTEPRLFYRLLANKPLAPMAP